VKGNFVKNLLVVALVVALIALVVIMAKYEMRSTDATKTVRQQEHIQNEVNRVLGGLIYMQDGQKVDGRTGLCFAYYNRTGGSTDNGPAIATVPCSDVPAGLLRHKTK